MTTRLEKLFGVHLSLNLRKVLSVFVVFYVAFIVSYYYVDPFSPFYALRIVIGVISLFLIPGYLFSFIMKNNFGPAEKLGHSLIFGIMIQLLSVVILWVMANQLPIPFTASICILTMLEVLGISIYITRKSLWSSQTAEKSTFDIFLLIIFCIALSASLYYQNFNTNYITPDGAYYCDIARNIFQHNRFISNDLFPNPQLNYFEQNGFSAHPSVPFVLSVFFFVGGANYFAAKFAVVLLGSLLVFPVFSICKKLFNERVGIIAAIIVAINPLRLFYSSILFGDEMVSNLFFLMAFFFFVLMFNSRNYVIPVVSGVLLYLSRAAWLQADFFLPLIPFLSLLITKQKINSRLFLFSAIFAGLAWVLTVFGLTSLSPGLWILIIAVQLSLCIICFRIKDESLRQVSAFFLGYTMLVLLGGIRIFMHSEYFVVLGATPGNPGSILLSVSGSIFDRTFEWVQDTDRLLGSFLLVLSILSVIVIQRLRKTVIVIAFPIFYSIVSIMYNSVGFEERFFVPLLSFMSILSASVIEWLFSKEKFLSFPNLHIRFVRNGRLLKIKWFERFVVVFLVAIVLSSLLFIYYKDQYSEELETMAKINPVGTLHMESVVDWIRANTSSDSIFMDPNPSFYSWLANRRCLLARGLNVTQLYETINQFNVDYLIIDPDASYWLSEIYECIKRDWQHPFPNFSVVFFKQYSSNIPEVIIYDVKDVRGVLLKKNTLSIVNCDSLENWSSGSYYYVGNVTLQLDTNDKIEGNASLMAQSDMKDFYISYKFFNDLNMSNAYDLSLWIKTNGLQTGGYVEVLITDSEGRWGNWAFKDWADTGWRNISLPINSYAEVSPKGPPNLEHISEIRIRTAKSGETGDSIKVWLDDISIISYEVKPRSYP